MDYKSKLQTNNTALEGNNVDLQTILDTINSLPEATEPINLDSEITTQDALIAELSNILDSKASGGSVKTTKTIHINWDDDNEWMSNVTYISNGEVITLQSHSSTETIEADNGVVVFYTPMGYYSDNFITLCTLNDGDKYVLVAKQDGETLYAVSDGYQDV